MTSTFDQEGLVYSCDNKLDADYPWGLCRYLVLISRHSVLQQLVTFFGSESGAVSEKLSEDSSNIVQLIRQAYEVRPVYYAIC